MGRRAKVWELRDDYRYLLIKTKKLFPTVLAHVKTKRIALAGVYNRRNSFMARIYSNTHPWSLLLKDYDYIIVFWSSRFDEKPLSYKVYVTLHELSHIPFDGFVRGTRAYRRCQHHDIEDFEHLREVYGIRLEKIKDVLKGESHLVADDGEPRRFPRMEKIH
jgi:predicted metallopeptidase